MAPVPKGGGGGGGKGIKLGGGGGGGGLGSTNLSTGEVIAIVFSSIFGPLVLFILGITILHHYRKWKKWRVNRENAKRKAAALAAGSAVKETGGGETAGGEGVEDRDPLARIFRILRPSKQAGGTMAPSSANHNMNTTMISPLAPVYNPLSASRTFPYRDPSGSQDCLPPNRPYMSPLYGLH